MATPDKAAVLEAMRSDLGVSRVDDLHLAGPPGSSVRLSQAGHASFSIPPPPPKRVLPIASKWKEAIARGEFDDEDAETVKGLDRIGGGRLHAQNKPAAPMRTSFQIRPIQGFPSSHSNEILRMPGAYPPTPEKSVRGAPTGPYRPGSSPGMSSMGVVLNGPIRRFEPGGSSARMPVQNVPKQPPLTTDAPATPVKHIGAQATVPQSPMPPTPPRDVPSQPPMVIAGSISRGVADNVDTEKTLRPKDLEPTEYVHKADIRVGDRLANGQGTVYLLAPSPTDPGTICIFLEGSKYLEYPVMSMFNYITNSEELCPQFREPDGISITTTSLVFGSQEKISSFMKALRTLKARKLPPSSTSASTAQPQRKLGTIAGPGPVAHPKKPPTNSVVSAGPIGEENQNGSKNIAVQHNLVHADKKCETPIIPSADSVSDMTNSQSKLLQPQPKPLVPVASEHPIKQAPTKQIVCEVTNDLLDLSLPTQIPSLGRLMHANRMSTYAMDLGSLESPVCDSHGPETEAETEERLPLSAPEMPTKAIEQPPSTEEASEHPNTQNAVVVTNQQDNQLTHEELMRSIENLRGYLLSILPTFEDMCQVMMSVDEVNRETVAKTVYSSIVDANDGDLAISEASAKQVLLALLSQSGCRERKRILQVQHSSNRTTYTAEEILQLRTKALPPPPQLSKVKFMQPVEKRAAPSARESQNIVPGRTQNNNPKKTLAAPEQKSQTSAQGHTQGSTPKKKKSAGEAHGASLQSNGTEASKSRTQTKHFNPEAPPFTHNIDNITAALAAVSLAPTNGLPAAPSALEPLQANSQPQAPAGKRIQKGLSGSRWATEETATLPTNASRFTGINFS